MSHKSSSHENQSYMKWCFYSVAATFASLFIHLLLVHLVKNVRYCFTRNSRPWQIMLWFRCHRVVQSKVGPDYLRDLNNSLSLCQVTAIEIKRFNHDRKYFIWRKAHITYIKKKDTILAVDLSTLLLGGEIRRLTYFNF